MRTIKYTAGAEPTELLVITSNKKYETIGNKIGSGAFAQVHLLGKDKVIKICNDNPRKFHIFRNELEIYKKLSEVTHDNIAQLLDYAVIYKPESLHNCLIFPHYGNSVNDLIEYHNSSHSVMPFTIACNIARGLASALSYLHSLSIIHTDAIPRNILLGDTIENITASTQVKLADFGSSCYEGKPVTNAVGTYEYCAPEVFKYENKSALPYTCKIDVWSAGATIFECFTGEYMFDLYGTGKTDYKWIPDHIYRGKHNRKTIEASPTTQSEHDLMSLTTSSDNTSTSDSGLYLDDEEYFEQMYELSASRKKYKLFISQYPSIPSDIAKLIQKCVKYNADHRITAAELLEYISLISKRQRK